jgi:cytochrome c peroxidase
MKFKKYIFFYLIYLILFSVGCNKQDKEIQELIKKSNQLFKPIPNKMPGFENVSKEQIELGKQLYFDKRLSLNDQQSCNSCHRVDNNGPGLDNKQVSDGALPGKKG